MAMLNAIVKGGFYPFPPEQLPAARSLFAPAPQEGGRCVLKALDPCAGERAALAYLGANPGLESYANELDNQRAMRCLALFGREQTVQGDLFRLRASNEAFALVGCNPPYGENYGGDDRRIELSALRHSWKWAMVGGYVAWVVYAHHMTMKAAEFLAANGGQADVYRLPGLHLGRQDAGDCSFARCQYRSYQQCFGFLPGRRSVENWRKWVQQFYNYARQGFHCWPFFAVRPTAYPAFRFLLSMCKVYLRACRPRH